MDPGLLSPAGEFCSVFALTACMEVGDVSSFYAVGLGLTLSKTAVFAGVMGAQVVVSAVSVVFGASILAKADYIFAASVCCFVLFALWSFYQAYNSKPQSEAELAEPLLDEAGRETEPSWIEGCWKAFFGTSISELGSKSQLVTCALSTKFRPIIVFSAAIAGVCTTLGILLYSSRLLETVLTPRKAYMISGVLFLVCALISLAES